MEAKIYYNPFIEGADRMSEDELIESVKSSLIEDYPELQDGELLSSIATVMVVEDDNVIIYDGDIMTEREARENGLL